MKFVLIGLLFLQTALSFAQTCRQCPAGYDPVPNSNNCTAKVYTDQISTPNAEKIIKGDLSSFYFSRNQYATESDENPNLPLNVIPSSNTTLDTTFQSANLTRFTLPQFWFDLVRVPSEGITLKGVNTHQWYSKTFCVNYPTEEHHQFFLGGDDYWNLSIDGQVIIKCDQQDCYQGGAIVSRTIPAGNHSIKIQFYSYTGAATLYYVDFQNSQAEVIAATQFSDLNPIFNSRDLIGQDWDQGSNVCPAGYTWDACAVKRCVKQDVQLCDLKLEVPSAVSCSASDAIKLHNRSTNPIQGIFNLQDLSGTNLYTSGPSNIPAAGTFSERLENIFSGQNLNLTAGTQYQLTFTPFGGAAMEAIKFTASASNCGSMTVSNAKPTCGAKVEINMTDLPTTGAQIKLGIKTPSAVAPIWQNNFQPVTGPSANPPVDFQSLVTQLGIPLGATGTYEVHAQIKAPFGPVSTKTTTVTIIQNDCGAMSITNQNPTCGQKASLHVTGLPLNPAAEIKWGIKTPGSATTIWQNSNQQVPGPQLLPSVDFLTLVNSLGISTSTAGTYTVSLQITSAFGVVSTQSQIVTLTNSACGGLTVTPSAPQCGESVMVGVNGVPLDSEYMFGVQTGTGAVAWTNQWKTPTNTTLNFPFNDLFPTLVTLPNSAYTVHFQTRSNFGIISVAQSATVNFPAACGQLTLATETCGQSFKATVSNLPTSQPISYRFGIQESSGNMIWSATQSANTSIVGPIDLTTLLPARSGKTYTVHFESQTLPFRFNSTLSSTLSYPVNTCGNLAVNKTQYPCGETAQVAFTNTYQGQVEATWALYGVDNSGNKVLPARSTKTVFYNSGESFRGSIYDLFSGLPLAPLLNGTNGDSSNYQLEVSSTDPATGRTSILPPAKFVVNPLPLTITSTAQSFPDHLFKVFAQQAATFGINGDQLEDLQSANISWDLPEASPISRTGLEASATWTQLRNDPITITTTVNRPNGCVSKATANIVINDNGPYLPNAFSPNQDGVNDVFAPLSGGIIWHRFEILNRWGEVVYQASGANHSIAWDGTSNGQEAPQDSYVVIGTYSHQNDPENKKLFFKGTVTLLR